MASTSSSPPVPEGMEDKADLNSQVALVLGGSKQFGQVAADELLNRGAQVIIVDQDEMEGETLTNKFNQQYSGNRCMFVKCNLRDMKEVDSLYNILDDKITNPLQIVINAPCFIDEESWSDSLLGNLHCVIQSSYLAINRMSLVNQGLGGCIINVSSLAALTGTSPLPAYIAAKSGVIGFTKSLPTIPGFNDHGVRIHCICPEISSPEAFHKLSVENSTLSHSQSGILKEKLDNFFNAKTPLPEELFANALLTLIRNKDKNGTVMRISADHGVEFQLQKKLSVQGSFHQPMGTSTNI